MSESFGTQYAAAYDLLYREKDYGRECDLIEDVFARYGKGVRRVLDLGCGTGNHAIPLAKRGYAVVGVDRSSGMIERARAKAVDLPDGVDVAFHEGDIQTLDLGERFDAALLMFAVLSYQIENDDVLAALRTARRHLEPGGLLIAEVWYGPAVLHLRPEDRVRVLQEGDRTVIRHSSGQLNTGRQVCRVHYRIWELDGTQTAGETEEEHLVRYFFPRELELILDAAGFRLLRLGRFPEFAREPDEDSWNVLAVASAC